MSTSTISVSTGSILDKQTQRLLDIPVGILHSRDREQAEELVGRLTRQASSSPDQVSRAWQLLDRIVQEDEALQQESDEMTIALRTNLLNLVVVAWRTCYDDETTMKPSDVLAKVSSYSPHFASRCANVYHDYGCSREA